MEEVKEGGRERNRQLTRKACAVNVISSSPFVLSFLWNQRARGLSLGLEFPFLALFFPFSLHSSTQSPSTEQMSLNPSVPLQDWSSRAPSPDSSKDLGCLARMLV